MSGSRFFCSLSTAILLNASEARSEFRSTRANSHPPLQFSLLLVTFNAIRMVSCPHAPLGWRDYLCVHPADFAPPNQSRQLGRSCWFESSGPGHFHRGTGFVSVEAPFRSISEKSSSCRTPLLASTPVQTTA